MHPTARGDRPIRIWQAGTTKAVLLGIHGGMSHSGDYETVGSFFRQHEVTTISFDLHGHGTRQLIDIPSFEVFIDDVVDMLEWVRQHYPTTPLFIVGHSMGALIGLNPDEIVIEHEHERAGQVHVHFPRLGFDVKPA